MSRHAPHAVALLMLLCCASGCLAAVTHHCEFDRIMSARASQPIAVVKELPQPQRNAQKGYIVTDNNWNSIRIVMSMKDLEDATKHCVDEGTSRPTFQGHNADCQSYDVVTLRTMTELTKTVIPAAIKLHADRLQVQRVAHAMKMPKFTQSVCRFFTVPEEHHSEGVPYADMVLYVAAGPGLTFGAPCATLGVNGRPIAGAMNFRLSDMHHPQVAARLAAHQIAHALGFSYGQMDALSMVSSGISVRGKTHNVAMVTSNHTKTMAQKHYDCVTAKGMELEDESYGAYKSHSHWERRNAKDELMAPIVGAGYYTALTMSVFEDMGFFRANWGMEEPMSWGSGAGCYFLTHKCVEGGATKYPNMFCTETTNANAWSCTSDRTSMGWCGTTKEVAALPGHYQYFEDKKTGGLSLALTDHCPVVTLLPFGGCSDGDSHQAIGGRISQSSWCLDVEGLQVYSDGALSESQKTSVGGVCAEVLCIDSKVRVRYLGDEDWHECPEGESLTPSTTSPGVFASGKIKCPMYAEVCTIAPSGRSLVNPNAALQSRSLKSTDKTVASAGSMSAKDVR
ncbi:putative surface protease GP63 [Trypanosoma grayi]|uniref:putative surface protease GP63 n=1 Tax=Trypanosoma grayi TaxID=71804 RepID=UPI0004F42FAA|nr:putative surface protease GP63 [Trypanosoma grayi]KEG07421.1 putative surface protease GP63 [Trypanosoma grayi]